MEKENYTAYDLEKEEPKAPGVKEIPDKSKQSENSEHSESSEESEGSENSENSESSEESEESAAARAEIENMIAEMGAEKLLEIIRGNRNAAIEQIMDEMDAPDSGRMPTGNSIVRKCNSIFDLAGLA